MRKIIAILLVLTMLFALSAAATADDGKGNELNTLSYITAWRGIEQGKMNGFFYQVGKLDMDFWAEDSLKAQEEIPEDCYLVLADEGKNVSISVRAIELEEGSDLEDLEDLVKADGAVSFGIYWVNGFDALMYSVEEDDLVCLAIPLDDGEAVRFDFQGMSNPDFSALASLTMCTVQPHALTTEDVALMMDGDLNVVWGPDRSVTYALDGSSITVSLWHDGLNAANIRDLKNWDEVRDIVISTFNLYVRALNSLAMNEPVLTMQFTDDEEELSFLTIEGGEIVYDAFAA